MLITIHAYFINTVAPYDVVITGDKAIPHGSRLRLRCSSKGGTYLHYRLRTPSRFYTGTHHFICNANARNGGNYTCTVTNDAGSSSNTVTVYGELVHCTYVCLCCYLVKL